MTTEGNSPGEPLAGRAQGYQVTIVRPNWLVRSLVTLVAAVLGVLAFVLFSGLIAVGIAVALVAALILWVRSWFRRQQSPNGMLDGRRNVRVVNRAAEDASSI